VTIEKETISSQQVSVVSGGTSGIGRAVLLRLAEQGYHVVAFGRDLNQTEETLGILTAQGLHADLLTADISDCESVKRVVNQASAKYGRIDCLCNCAGIRPGGTILETEEDTWDLVMNVNLKGMFL
jgi:NAD(P)-dependent dehydrogenase (short-subunit alcohol dehydrogenase family)